MVSHWQPQPGEDPFSRFDPFSRPQLNRSTILLLLLVSSLIQLMHKLAKNL